jgi:Cu/Ag efflux protein CusF
MQRKHVGVSVIAFLLLAGPAVAETARGVITKVDLNSKEVTIRGKGKGTGKGTMKFSLSNDARVTVGRDKGTAKDLRVGKRVRVQYETQDNDQRVIKSIRVQGQKGTDGRPILGRVKDIDLEKRQITVRGRLAKGEPRREITLELPKDAKVTRAGKPYSVDNLGEGTLVRVLYRDRNGKRVAQSIQVIDPEALISRMRESMKKADNYLKMAEFYLKMVEKPKKTAKRRQSDQGTDQE